MITVTASPTLPANTVVPVSDGTATANTSTISGVNSTGGFSNTLTSQINLLAQPTTDAALATTVPPTILPAILAATTQNAAPVVNANVATNLIATTIPPQILPQTPVSNLQKVVSPTTNATTVTPDVAMSATDTAILSSVNDTLNFISTGAKLGDTLSTGQAVQLPIAQSATPNTTQIMQSATKQSAVINSQITTPAAVLAQQVTPIQVATETVKAEKPVDVIVQTPVQTTPASPVVTAQVQTPVQTTPASPVVTAQVQSPVQTMSASPVVTAQIQTPVQTTPASPVVTAQVQSPVQTTPASPVVAAQVQTPVQTTPTSPVVTAQVQTPVDNAPSPQIQTLVTQQEIPAKAEKKSDIKNVKTDENTQAAPALLVVAETPTLTVSQPVITPEKSTIEKPKQNAPKSEKPDLPVAAQQVTPEIIAPLVTAQAAPAQSDAKTAVFESTNQSGVTSDGKTVLTPAKNLLMAAVASRGNTNDNSPNNNNGGNSQPNQTVQIESSANPIIDNKTSVTDAKSFASLLTAEKSDTTSASATAPTTDKSAPQNISAAVNKLVQDTKVDVPAMTRPLSHPAWNQELGSRIVWMNNQGISSAEIKMNPQNMGPITVRIDMNQDQATIAFTAQNSEVRTALENSIPKLREMLSSQNVGLADVNVSQQSSTSTSSDSNKQQTAQMMMDASTNGQGNRQNNPEVVDAQGNSVSQVDANGNQIIADEFANAQPINTNNTNGLLSIYA